MGTIWGWFSSSASSIKRLRMLLIDEVDVFFQKEFYGNVYSPLAKVCDSTVSALLCHIYTNRADPKQLSLRNIYNSQAFQACISRFPNWTELLEESVKCMVSDVKTFETHNYQVLRGQISYADQDAMSFNKQFGYKTTFAYFFEMEKGRIDKNICDEHLYLLVKCGSFSYAEIPNMYHSVLGVSGTLSTLSPAERKLLTEGFGIKKITHIPSVYGPNQLEFRENSVCDIKISQDHATYFTEIVNEMKCRLIGSTSGVERSSY